jgi:hypothetical protein
MITRNQSLKLVITKQSFGMFIRFQSLGMVIRNQNHQNHHLNATFLFYQKKSKENDK